jgi:hypothetical protein
MPFVIKVEFESSVTNAYGDVFIKSYIENKTTIIEFDLRNRNYRKELNAKSNVKWDGVPYSVDISELSTMHCPIKYRFIIAQGNYYNTEGERKFFTPTLEEVSTSQHVSKSVIRLCAYLAVICGVSLRNISAILQYLFLINITKSTVKRWIDDLGENLPSEEEILKKLIAIQRPTECNIDGYYPKGTDNCVMVVKDEYDRILITHEAQSESKDEAVVFLKKLKNLGLNITVGFSDYSKSFIDSIKEVYPDAKFQADHFHTVKNIWKNLKKAYIEFRRGVKEKAEGSKSKDKKQAIDEFATKLWEMRWLFLKKPCNLSVEEQCKISELEKIDDSGYLKCFRSILKNIVSIFDTSDTEASAKAKLERLRNKATTEENKHYLKIIKFFDDHWNEAMQYLKKDGTEKRSSNSESGMRMLRRLEKNHDGIRSEKTRKNYVKIFQTIKYLANEDIADYINDSAPGG